MLSEFNRRLFSEGKRAFAVQMRLTVAFDTFKVNLTDAYFPKENEHLLCKCDLQWHLTLLK